VARSLARSMRKRESSKPTRDASRNETIIHTIPVDGNITPSLLVNLLDSQPSFPPSGRVNTGPDIGMGCAEEIDEAMTPLLSDSGSEEDEDISSRSLQSHGPFTDPALDAGSIIEFWWPTESFIGMVIGKLHPNHTMHQITACSGQVSLFHRPSAYEVYFPDEIERLGLSLPNELRVQTTGGGSGGKIETLNSWTLLGTLPTGNEGIEDKAKELGLCTTRAYIPLLTFRTAPAELTVHFKQAVPLGINFVIDEHGQVRVHSFACVAPGISGPARHSIVGSLKDHVSASDVVHSVNNMVISQLPRAERLASVQGLIGPTTLTITRTIEPLQPNVHLVGVSSPDASQDLTLQPGQVCVCVCV